MSRRPTTAASTKPASFSAGGGGSSKKGSSAASSKPVTKAAQGPQLSVERKIPITLEKFEEREQYKTQFFDERIRATKNRIFYILDHNTDKTTSKSEFIRFNKFKFVRVKAFSHIKAGEHGLYFGFLISKEQYEFLAVTRHNIIGQYVLDNPHIFFSPKYIKKELEALLSKPFVEWTEDERKKVFESKFKWIQLDADPETGEVNYVIFLSIDKSQVPELEEYPSVKIGQSIADPAHPGKFVVEPLYNCPKALFDFVEPTQRVKEEHAVEVAEFQKKFQSPNDALEDDCMKLWSSIINVIPKELGLANPTADKPLQYSWRLEEIIIMKKNERSGQNNRMGADFNDDDLRVEEEDVATNTEGAETTNDVDGVAAAAEDDDDAAASAQTEATTTDE